MANRSKKTVLSVRISPFFKSSLDVLAALQSRSLPDLVEDLIDQAFERQEVMPPAFIKQERLTERGTVRLAELMRFIWIDDAVLFKIRLHLLAPDALSERDRLITGSVFNNLQIFKGEDRVFGREASSFVMDSPEIPKLNLKLISLFWPLLTDYARFLSLNELKLSLPDYMDMLRKSGELDEIYDVL